MKSVLLLMTITSGARASVLSPTSREILLSRQLSLIGPSEIPVGTPPQGPAHSLLDHHSSPFEDESALSGEGRDFSRIKEIATAVCLHRGLEPERVLPKLVAFFDNADEQIDEDKTEQRPRVSAEKQDTNATRPPSWAPGDDAAIQGEARSSTEFWHDGDRPRRPTQTSELSQPRRGSVTSDLSISSSEETGQEEEHTKQPLIKTKTKIPSPCPEVGSGAHRRQADGSSGHLVGSPTTMSRPGSGSSDKVVLSSSVSSHRTAFRRSSDRLDYYGSAAAVRMRLRLRSNGSMSRRTRRVPRRGLAPATEEQAQQQQWDVVRRRTASGPRVTGMWVARLHRSGTAGGCISNCTSNSSSRRSIDDGKSKDGVADFDNCMAASLGEQALHMGKLTGVCMQGWSCQKGRVPKSRFGTRPSWGNFAPQRL
ncbi:hypothetical protein IWZ00DRAFT_109858 [Phyllosticta capitalensis]